MLLHALLGAGCATASTPQPEIVPTKETAKPAPAPVPSPSVSASVTASASAPPVPSGHVHVVPIYGAPIVVIERVLFDLRSSTVTKQHDAMLKTLSELITARSDLFFAIDGRAETAEGTDASARTTLSKKRAEAVLARLIGFGVDPKRLRINALGDTRPIGAGLDRSASFRLELEDGSTPQ